MATTKKKLTKKVTNSDDQVDIEEAIQAVEDAFDIRPTSEPKRRMKGEKTVYHDLFKLESSTFKKILGVADERLLRTNPNAVRMADVEHCHFFHSVDSNGRPQKYSSSIGGHCHEVKITIDDNGEFVAECGPPMVKRGNSRVEIKNNYDFHTHEIDYIESHDFKARKANIEAVKYKSQFTVPPTPSDAM